MRFGSVCSGIEAASAAFGPLGWEAAWLAEIEAFPSAVLAHHYPSVPNLGDMTKIAAMVRDEEIEAPDLLCGGTPCQSFSVAGLRKSLDDARGNLSLEFIRIANAIDDIRRNHGRKPAYILWENVPGVLSTKDNAFGAFLGGLCGRDAAIHQPGGGWTSAGVVAGPQRVVAWRVLDAQYFGLAQRRRRVFVLALGGAGGWACADALLSIHDSLQGHPAPSRQARKVAPTIPSRSTAGGGLGTDFDCDGGLQVAGTMKACKDSGGWSNSADHAAAGYMVPVETLCVATGQAGAEIGADMAPTLNCNHEAPYVAKPVGVTIHGTDKSVRVASFTDVAGCLRADVPGRVENSSSTVVAQPVPFDTTQITSAANYSNPKAGDPCRPLAAGMHAPAIAFPANLSATQHASTEELSPSLCAVNPTAVAFNMHKSGNAASSMGVADERTDCLRAFEKSPFAVAYTTKLHNTASNNAGKVFEERSTCLDANSPPPALLTAMQVRRLTPEECEALQGFPRGHTLIPWRKKPASECPDGPRYKALGNSWAVPVAAWIGRRIEAVESINSMKEAA